MADRAYQVWLGLWEMLEPNQRRPTPSRLDQELQREGRASKVAPWWVSKPCPSAPTIRHNPSMEVESIPEPWMGNTEATQAQC
jgi:hypothetical protein